MCYNVTMPDVFPLSPAEIAAARKRRLVAQHLQALEGNPLTADEIAMFDMFDREGWSGDRCRDFIREALGLHPATK